MTTTTSAPQQSLAESDDEEELQLARIDALISWCEREGYLLDPRAEILVQPGGWGVGATARFEEGEILAAFPQESFLSVRTCAPPKQLLEADTRLGSTLELALILLWELLQGPRSRWWDYLFSLPDVQVLPPLWPWEEPHLATARERRWMDLLRYTEVGEMCTMRARLARADPHSGIGGDETLSFAALEATMSATRVEFLSAHFPGHGEAERQASLRTLHACPPCTMRGWRRALARCCAVVSSRAFVLDEQLGLALCPVADVFNHRAPGQNGVQLEVGADGMAVMRCTRALECGEVYNTYGPLGRAELLCRYGFAPGLVAYGSSDSDGSDSDPSGDVLAAPSGLDEALRVYLAGAAVRRRACP